MMKPLLVEVIAYAPTQYYHCAHCEVLWKETGASNVQKWHDEMLKTSMPPEMMKEYNVLSDWVLSAVERYGGRVVFQVIDAASFEGLFKSVRYGVRKYPAVVIRGMAKQIGADFGQADTLIDQGLAQMPA
jgi:hypothetical protein